jgi:hypothetical protein
MFDHIALYPNKLTATYSKWGNLYRARFYIDGKRVPEWKFNSVLNSRIKTDSGYNRTIQNTPKNAWYRIVWTKG